MKKVSILMVAIATVSFVSSCAQSPKPTLKTDIDSLSYATGIMQTNGLQAYLSQQAGIDSTQMDEFIKGVNKGATMTGNKAYMEGLRVGQMISQNWVKGINQQIFQGDSTKTINKNDLLAGFIAGAKNDTTRMSMQFAQTYNQTATERIQLNALLETYGDNKEAGEKFLAENKTKEGVETTESGLQYKVITMGKGEKPTPESTVKVHYKGTLIDGTEFDSSYTRNEPTMFRASQVILGWTEALTMMPVGSKWELYIPQELAYGKQNQGQIKPFSALIFEVELVGIENQ